MANNKKKSLNRCLPVFLKESLSLRLSFEFVLKEKKISQGTLIEQVPLVLFHLMNRIEYVGRNIYRQNCPGTESSDLICSNEIQVAKQTSSLISFIKVDCFLGETYQYSYLLFFAVLKYFEMFSFIFSLKIISISLNTCVDVQ